MLTRENEQQLKNYWLLEDYFFSVISKEKCVFLSLASAYFVDVDNDAFNMLYIKRIDDEKQFLMLTARAEIFFSSRQKNFTLAITDYLLDANILDHLNKMQFVEDAKTTAMLLELKQFSGNNQKKNDIRLMNDSLNDWTVPLRTAFEASDVTLGQYLSCHQSALVNGNQLLHYSYYMNNKPVCSLTASLQGELARLDDIGTDTAHQRRGYASELIQFVLEELQSKGVKYCFLEASSEGLSVYQRQGFKPLFEYNIFIKEKASEA